MMRKTIYAAIAALLLATIPAAADYVIRDGNGNLKTIKAFTCGAAVCPSSVPIDISGVPLGTVGNPMVVSGSFSATTTATAASTLPTLTAGSNAFYESLKGGLYVQPIFGTTIVDGSNGLPVAIVGTPAVTISGTVTVTGSVAITGSVAVTGPLTDAQLRASAVPVSAASLPLPALAATSTLQTSGGQKTQIVDGSGNVIASTSNNLNVQCANCSGSGVSAADGASFTAGVSLFAGAGGAFQTDPTSNPLGNGKQGFVQLTATRSFFSNLRNAAGTEVGTAGAPLQVSLANTAANATAVKVDGSASTQPVSGTVAVSGNVTVVQGTGTNLHVACDNCAATSSNFGATFPTAGTAVGMSQGGNMVAFTGTSGNLNVSQQGTVTVSGTVTANAGTNLNTSLLALETGGNLASLVTQIGAVTASPTANTVNDRLKTINTTLGTPFQAGGSIGNTSFEATQATAASLNATVVGTGTFAVQATLAAETTKVIGTVNQGTSPWVISGTVTAPNASVVAQGTALGSTSVTLAGASVTTNAPTFTAGNINQLSLTPAGGLRIDLKDTAANTNNLNVNLAASGATVTITGTVTANAGTGTLATSNAALALAQGSTTSGQAGPLIQGAVTTAAPSYTTAQTSPLSLTTAGGLRVDLATIAGTAAVNGSGTATGALRVEIANNGTGVIATVGAVTTVSTVTTLTGVTNFAPAAGATALLKLEDAASASGDAGVGALAIQRATPADTANDLDYSFLQMSSGRLWASTVITDGTTQANVIAGTNALKTDMSSVAGTATATAASGVQKVGMVGNAGGAVDAATAAAAPANALQVGVNVGGNLQALVGDPCQVNAHAFARIDIASAATSVLVTGTSAKKTYICGMMLFSAGTTNVGIVEGSGSTCGTSTLGLIGGNTAAKGPNLTAQAGFQAGSGAYAIATTTVNANDICLINSAAIQVSGYIVTAVQ